MSNDFSKYKNIIESFRGKVLKPDFEAKFAKATETIVKSERFLLKMELKRLASACTRLIDLRGHVDGECKAFEHENRTHFLDDTAIRVFEENMQAYGTYTFGVYESVNNTDNNFRVMYQKEKSGEKIAAAPTDKPKVLEKLQYPAKYYTLGNYINRKEERMNFAIPLIIEINGQKLLATSSDLSVHGCKFKFDKPYKLEIGQTLQIKFVGLEQEFQLGDKSLFSYDVCNIHIEEKIQLIGVKRVDYDENDHFITFLQGFIQGNKRRYKVNLQNTIDAIQARSLEQFALPNINELPVFVERQSEKLRPRFALTNNNNQSVFQYWQDEKRSSTLHYLINNERIERIQKAAKLGRSLLVYSFIHHSQGRSYYYSVDDIQLLDDKKFMAEFLKFASNKASFAITELTCVDVNLNDAISAYTLANVIAKKDEYLNLPPSDEVNSILAKVPYLIVVNDITDKRLTIDYQEISADAINTDKLKTFGHKRLVDPVRVDELGINYKNHRMESRFIYQTPVSVQSSSVAWEGTSVDFSMSGLKVELTKPAVLSKGEVVYLSFPALQKVTTAFELSKLPYEVIRINQKKNIINLRVFVEKHQHIGRAFFKLLIEKNKHKLTPDQYAIAIPGLGKALRNIYTRCNRVNHLFIQTSGSRYKIEAIGGSPVESKLFALMRRISDRPNHYNLYPLLSNQQVMASITATLKKLQTTEAPYHEILYISIEREIDTITKSVVTRLDSQMTTPMLKRMFIARAKKRGHFFCILLKLSKNNEPDMEYLNPELSYVSTYAIHRGKQLEQEIYSVAGVVQCFDITQEALTRHQLLKDDSR